MKFYFWSIPYYNRISDIFWNFQKEGISLEIYKFKWRKSFVCSLCIFLSIVISRKIKKKKQHYKIQVLFYLLFYIVLYFIVIRKNIWSIRGKELIKKIKKNLLLIAKNETAQLWAKKIYDLPERNVLQKSFCTKFGPLADTFTRVTVHLKKIECFAKQTKISILRYKLLFQLINFNFHHLLSFNFQSSSSSVYFNFLSSFHDIQWTSILTFDFQIFNFTAPSFISPKYKESPFQLTIITHRYHFKFLNFNP